MDEQQQHIEREVQRKLSSERRRHNEEVASLRAILKEQQDKLIEQHEVIQQLGSVPYRYAVVHTVHNKVDVTAFQPDDRVMVIDEEAPNYKKVGSITEVNDGIATVAFEDGSGQYSIGLNEPQQIHLAEKSDGRFVVAIVDGKLWELEHPAYDLSPGDFVKVNEKNQIVGHAEYDLNSGPICTVEGVVDQCVEINNKGERYLVYNPQGIELKDGDKIAVDSGYLMVVKKLDKDNRKRYTLGHQSNINWDSIGGLERPKEMIREFLELPYSQPELFEHYGMSRPKGAVLHGPPGCGKTLLARLCAWLIAEVHGKEVIDTGYLFVKGPEILDMYVGNSEGEIRGLFARGREHYRQHGYPALLAIDEADAIMPQRGTRRSSDIADTLVPMFLGEMDGVDEEQTKENPIVILMTNRIDILDPAVIRAERISHHIKIDRPDEDAALDIMAIHTSNTPFKGDKKQVLAVTVADIFSRSRLLYRINNEHDFSFADTINGAMLKQISESAKMIALKRDVREGTSTGVDIMDFRQAVQEAYKEQEGLNHAYDLHDFAEKHHLQSKDMTVTRCFGAA